MTGIAAVLDPCAARTVGDGVVDAEGPFPQDATSIAASRRMTASGERPLNVLETGTSPPGHAGLERRPLRAAPVTRPALRPRLPASWCECATRAAAVGSRVGP